jgi:phospho-N-acetylmuramoyl-pentapeptide-transferase
MGGVIFLIPIVLVSLFVYFSGTFKQVLPLMLVTIGFGIVGFLDDLIKIIKRSKDGLSAKQKMFGLLLVATAFAFYCVYGGLTKDINIDFIGMDISFNKVWIFILFVILLLVSTTNGVNMTDGLDGLASGVTLIVMITLSVISMTKPEWDYVKVFTAITAGGCLGFLAFNMHPAKVFMGDTGSLALGGAVGAASVVMKLPPVILILLCVIYACELLSVAIQVISFKLRGKRVFKMAPIHHHFELMGWKETKVVYVFWIVTAVVCLAGLYALQYKIY